MKILIRSAALFLAALCLHAQTYAQTKPDRFKEQLAIENYEKSLKLDAGNANAVEMLKKLKEQ